MSHRAAHASSQQHCAYCTMELPYEPIPIGLDDDEKEDIKTANRAIYKAHLIAEHPEIAEAERRERERERKESEALKLQRHYHMPHAEARRESMLSTLRERIGTPSTPSPAHHRQQHKEKPVEFYAKQRERREARAQALEARLAAEKQLAKILDVFPPEFGLRNYPTWIFRVNKKKYHVEEGDLHVSVQREVRPHVWQDYLTLPVKQLLDHIEKI